MSHFSQPPTAHMRARPQRPLVRDQSVSLVPSVSELGKVFGTGSSEFLGESYEPSLKICILNWTWWCMPVISTH